jgi:DNA-binding beta-propeller fold protein YncE
MNIFNKENLHILGLFIFSIGLGLGLGGSVVRLLLSTMKKADKQKLAIKKTFLVIWVGIVIYGVGGAILFGLAYKEMLKLGIFYASFTIAISLIALEKFLLFRRFSNLKNMKDILKGQAIEVDEMLVGSTVVTIAAWLLLTLHHSMHLSEISYFAFMAAFTTTALVGLMLLFLLRHKTIEPSQKTRYQATIAVFLLATFVLFGVHVYSEKNKPEEEKNEKQEKTYTMAEVTKHNRPEDCWLVIDNLVFNATEAAVAHPAMFNCGTDASANYHKNHGDKISDKMMKFYIGKLSGEAKTEAKTKSYDSLSPTKELYAEVGSWENEELMAVVEKDAENILFIDGTDHETVGRIKGVGFQPHTSVFSPDKKYMYINLSTLEPEIHVRVGTNSRGTALTDDGKYLAVGNYEPHNIVVVDADTMKTVKTIDASGTVDGKSVGSRVGVVVEKGQDFIVGLKDVNSVWVIGQNNSEWVVKNKYDNIGKNQSPMHDGYLTPDGKYFVIAVQGANAVWVLNTANWQTVGEVATGKTPHTGPGATWGNTTYVPALEEGLITAINTETWQPVASIKTGGPGLFVRSYFGNPNYPYVWADTAFGEHKDEIYVIDARTNTIAKTLIPVKGKSSWHPEFTLDGSSVYVVSQEGNEVTVYDANNFEVKARIKADTPSAVSNVGLRVEEPGL